MERASREVASLILGELTFRECLNMRAVNCHWNNLVVKSPKVWAVKGTTGEEFLRGLWRVKAEDARKMLRTRKPQEHIRMRKKKIQKWEQELESFEQLKRKKTLAHVRRGVSGNIEMWKTKMQKEQQEIKRLKTEEDHYRSLNVDADKMSFIF